MILISYTQVCKDWLMILWRHLQDRSRQGQTAGKAC